MALSRGFGGKGGRGWREDRGLRIEGDVVLAVFGPCHHILEREFALRICSGRRGKHHYLPSLLLRTVL